MINSEVICGTEAVTMIEMICAVVESKMMEDVLSLWPRLYSCGESDYSKMI